MEGTADFTLLVKQLVAGDAEDADAEVPKVFPSGKKRNTFVGIEGCVESWGMECSPVSIGVSLLPRWMVLLSG